MEKTQVAAEAAIGETGRLRIAKKKVLPALIKVGISAGLIYWILQGTDLREVFAAAGSANTWLLVLAFSLHIGGLTLSAYRWRLLLHTRGTDVSILFLIESYLVGVFFNNFLPSTVGGDAYRAYDSWRLGQSRSGAVAVVFIDRFLGLLVLMLFALLALLVSNQLMGNVPYLHLWVLSGTAGMLAATWLMFAPPRGLPEVIGRIQFPFRNKIRSIMDAFLAFKGQREVLFKALGISVLLQANVVIHYYLIARSLSLPIPFYSFFLIIPLTTVITLLPISVNGIGVRENAYVFFFTPFAVLKPEAVAFAWIAYGMVVVQGVMGGLIYGLRK
ncbi:MAG TPA: lysylphosphatidylglycerol synthase transmembrane domain-containing protein [Anaerolineae bacterium]